MKRALVLHGWTENPKRNWYQNELDYLKKLGYKAEAPLMPERFLPHENAWLSVIEEFAPDEETVLIGHSLGGTTILEYLEKTNIKVDKVILAGTPIRYTEKLDFQRPYSIKLYAQSVSIQWLLDTCGYEEIYDWEKLRSSANHYHLVYKKDDIRVPLDDGLVLAARLDADLDIEEGNDHVHYITLETLNKVLL